jgi:hypothetical protein
MNVTINGQEIPRNSLHTIDSKTDGTAHISGETINKSDSRAVTRILDSVKDADEIEFEVKDKNSKRFRGSGIIINISTEEQGAGTSRGIRYWFSIQRTQ